MAKSRSDLDAMMRVPIPLMWPAPADEWLSRIATTAAGPPSNDWCRVRALANCSIIGVTPLKSSAFDDWFHMSGRSRAEFSDLVQRRTLTNANPMSRFIVLAWFNIAALIVCVVFLFNFCIHPAPPIARRLAIQLSNDDLYSHKYIVIFIHRAGSNINNYRKRN